MIILFFLENYLQLTLEEIDNRYTSKSESDTKLRIN